MGVGKNPCKAVKWYHRAAEQGDPFGQLHLGHMHTCGEGVPEDYVQAYAWLNLASIELPKVAGTARDRIRQKMTPDQIAQGQQLGAILHRRIEALTLE